MSSVSLALNLSHKRVGLSVPLSALDCGCDGTCFFRLRPLWPLCSAGHTLELYARISFLTEFLFIRVFYYSNRNADRQVGMEKYCYHSGSFTFSCNQGCVCCWVLNPRIWMCWTNIITDLYFPSTWQASYIPSVQIIPISLLTYIYLFLFSFFLFKLFLSLLAKITCTFFCLFCNARFQNVALYTCKPRA